MLITGTECAAGVAGAVLYDTAPLALSSRLSTMTSGFRPVSWEL